MIKSIPYLMSYWFYLGLHPGAQVRDSSVGQKWWIQSPRKNTGCWLSVITMSASIPAAHCSLRVHHIELQTGGAEVPLGGTACAWHPCDPGFNPQHHLKKKTLVVFTCVTKNCRQPKNSKWEKSSPGKSMSIGFPIPNSKSWKHTYKWYYTD